MSNRLLYISSSGTDAADPMLDALCHWEICRVASLVEADIALRGDPHRVGLFVFDGAFQRLDDMEAFLCRHRDVQWVGVFERGDLDRASCRDIVAEHLHDYHTAPIDPVRLAYTLGHAHGWAMLQHAPRPASEKAVPSAYPLIGASEAMDRLRATLERVAGVGAPVLIWGESGSGKDLAAQAIHALSDRAGGPFVPINCGAIAPTLIHAELFGYERGAFTGAVRARAGLIESAHGGTLFLDEIADLPRDMQANLLRFLQEKTVCRLGSTRPIDVDVRVVAASHVALQGAVASGTFREDLYYRLAVLPVTVPPLRERRADLAALVAHVLALYAHETSARLTGMSAAAMQAIQEHDWPGNVRELINRVRRALVMSEGPLVTPEDLCLEQGPIVSPPVTPDRGRHGERAALRACLERSGQNVSRAARAMGVSRTTMYRLLSMHDMRP